MPPRKASALICSVCLHSAALAFALQVRLPQLAGDPDSSEMSAFLEPGAGSEAPSESVDFPEPPVMPSLEMALPTPVEPVLELQSRAVTAPASTVVPKAAQIVAAAPRKKRSSHRTGALGMGRGGQNGNYLPPSYLSHPRPAYPKEALQARFQGVVLLMVNVTAEGKPAAIEVLKSSGHPVLDRSAVRAVEGWVFQPAYLDGRAVSAKVEVPVRFAL